MKIYYFLNWFSSFPLFFIKTLSFYQNFEIPKLKIKHRISTALIVYEKQPTFVQAPETADRLYAKRMPTAKFYAFSEKFILKMNSMFSDGLSVCVGMCFLLFSQNR